jgi:hypothetical protein
MSAFRHDVYERFLYALEQTYTEISSSSVHFYTTSRQSGQVRGIIWFHSGLELRVFELIDLVDGDILEYSYTVFHRGERIRWYDPQPHPENPDLAATFPHHRHEPPDIKHNRRPAPGISFETTNLVILIRDCIELAASLVDPE